MSAPGKASRTFTAVPLIGSPGATGMGKTGAVRREPLVFEQGSAGREGFSLPHAGEFTKTPEVPGALRRSDPGLEVMTGLSELEVVRHFTRLSQWNYGIDTGMYPLGSCTMKYNPRTNEAAARLRGFAQQHPLAPVEHSQGFLAVAYALQEYLKALGGFAAVSLHPAAGAQGELTGVIMMRAYHTKRGNPRQKIIVPDTAHGTNPATSALNGYEVLPVRSNERGIVTAEAVAALMDDTVAGIMLTNPNTLGIFEADIGRIAGIVHGKGGLVYGDGANFNALIGVSRPGDAGIDVMHINLHKTFSTPHGGGGPGAGPVGVSQRLEPHLPEPLVVKRGDRYDLATPQESIGRLKAFAGNMGMVLRAYLYVRELGHEGLAAMTRMAVLNAAYVRARLKDTYHLPYETPSLHEVVFSDKNQKARSPDGSAKDIAKRLMDYGFHPPTVYFPLVVPGALMIEPTESESKETLDEFIAAMQAIDAEVTAHPELLREAPHHAPVGRLDETRAARQPILRYRLPRGDGG